MVKKVRVTKETLWLECANLQAEIENLQTRVDAANSNLDEIGRRLRDAERKHVNDKEVWLKTQEDHQRTINEAKAMIHAFLATHYPEMQALESVYMESGSKAKLLVKIGTEPSYLFLNHLLGEL